MAGFILRRIIASQSFSSGIYACAILVPRGTYGGDAIGYGMQVIVPQVNSLIWQAWKYLIILLCGREAVLLFQQLGCISTLLTETEPGPDLPRMVKKSAELQVAEATTSG
jgi:hypothetical protein